MKNIKSNIFILSLILACSVQKADARSFSFFSSTEKEVNSKQVVIDERAPDSRDTFSIEKRSFNKKPIVADEKAPDSRDTFSVEKRSFNKKPIIADERAPDNRDAFSVELKYKDYTKSNSSQKKNPSFNRLVADEKAPELKLDMEKSPKLDKRKKFQKELSLEEKAMQKEEAKLKEKKEIEEKRIKKVVEPKKMNKEVQYEMNFENYQMKKNLQRIKKEELEAKAKDSEFSGLTKKQMFQMIKSMDASGADFYKKSYTDIDKINMQDDDELKEYINDNLSEINVFRGYGARDKQDFSQRIKEDERFKREIIEGNKKSLDKMNDRVKDLTGLDVNDLEDSSPIKIKDIEEIADSAGAGYGNDDVDIEIYADEKHTDDLEIRDIEKIKDHAREKDLQRYDEIEKRDRDHAREDFYRDRDHIDERRYDEDEFVRIDKPGKRDYQRKEFRRVEEFERYDDRSDYAR